MDVPVAPHTTRSYWRSCLLKGIAPMAQVYVMGLKIAWAGVEWISL